ncbi:MAG: tRNA (adenosine(37)-N6)-dimethylallyltransferase MiaA [Pseudomonadota bacterium]
MTSELAQVPHRLIDIRDPHETFSAADFAQRAQGEIADIARSGGVPLLVGGTGLYFRAWEQGLSPLPSADADVRAELSRRAATVGWPALHRELAEVDPARAAEIHPHDAQRIQRALEIYRLTGRAPSSFPAPSVNPGHPVLRLILAPSERHVLHDAIAARFDAMLANGLVEEVEELRRDSRLSARSASMRAVGYRQTWAHLEGEYDRVTLREKGIISTRQLARRQLTWLRRLADGQWLDTLRSDVDSRLATTVSGFLDRHLVREKGGA